MVRKEEIFLLAVRLKLRKRSNLLVEKQQRGNNLLA